MGEFAGTEFESYGVKYVMDAHGSLTRVEDGSPGKSRTLLRGNFSIVEYSSRTGEPETFIVLQGLEPGNRKLVYRLSRAEAHSPDEDSLLDADVLYAGKRQDSPGMARDGWERAK